MNGYIKEVLAGNASAYSKIIAAHEFMLRRVVSGILADQHLIEDVLQEVFLVAYRRLSTYRSDAPFGAWIYTIAVREAMRTRKRWRNEQGRSQLLGNHDPMDPDSQSEKTDGLEEAIQILSELGQNERAAFVLHSVEAHSYEEVAMLLECSSGTVGSLIHRAKKSLKEILVKRRKK